MKLRMAAPAVLTNMHESAKAMLAIGSLVALAFAAGAMGLRKDLDANDARDKAQDAEIADVREQLRRMETMQAQMDRMLCLAEETARERQGQPPNWARCAR